MKTNILNLEFSKRTDLIESVLRRVLDDVKTGKKHKRPYIDSLHVMYNNRTQNVEPNSNFKVSFKIKGIDKAIDTSFFSTTTLIWELVKSCKYFLNNNLIG